MLAAPWSIHLPTSSILSWDSRGRPRGMLTGESALCSTGIRGVLEKLQPGAIIDPYSVPFITSSSRSTLNPRAA